jgi:outer membrane beta-barrel protein
MTRRTAIGTLSLAALLLGVAPSTVRGSEADAFENKIPPVSGQLYGKAGRFELTPTVQLSLNDAFYSKYMGGLKAGYHFSDSFYAGLAATGGFSSTTGSATRCAPGAGCTPAEPWRLYQVPGLIRWIAGAEVAFSPVYGKLNVFAEKAVHFDLSLIAGVDLVSFRDVDTSATLASPEPGNASSPGGHLGVGARVFFGRFMAVRLELKDVLYSVPHLSTGKLQSQLMADIGLSFFLPVTPARTP